MTTIEFLNSPVARALGWTILHAVWQGFALVLPTALTLHLLRRRGSQLRYWLGAATLFVQLMLSAGTFIWYYHPATVAVHATATAIPLHWTISTRLFVAHPLPWSQQVLLFLDAHLGQFVCVYLAGLVVFGLRLAGGWWHSRQFRQSASGVIPAMEQALVDQLRTALAIRPVVRVRESARVAVPMVIGALKPMLLLPLGLATGLNYRELEAILAHELAHIKRHDYAVNLLQSVVEVIYFFHPALWWLSARVREEREHCCDDLAVRVCGDNGRALVQALARIEEMRLTQAGTPALAMAFTGRRQLLLHRVQRVLGLSTRSMVSNRSLAGLTLAALLLISASVYAIQQQNKPQQPRPKAPAPARRSSTPASTELHFDTNHKLTYVMWKGQKLPATRVADLQQKWEQVMSGQVNLDDISQPDRAILLNVIESQYGKVSSSEQEKYEAIAEAALQNIPLSPDGTVEGLAKVNYDSIIQTALSSLHDAKASLDTIIEPDGMTFRRRYDSLAELREINQEKIAVLESQTRSQQFAIQAIERSIEQLERQKMIVERHRFSQTMRQQRLVLGSGATESDSAQAAIDKQVATSEAAIRKIESELDAIERQLMSAQAELEKAQKPLRNIESQIRRLNSAGDGWGTSVSSTRGFTSGGFQRQSAATSLAPLSGTGITTIRGTAVMHPIKPVRPAIPLKPVKGRVSVPAPPVPPK